jgi:hypothetical protein
MAEQKRKRLAQPRQALEGLAVKSFFDFMDRTEAARGARRWSWPITQSPTKESTGLNFIISETIKKENDGILYICYNSKLR